MPNTSELLAPVAVARSQAEFSRLSASVPAYARRRFDQGVLDAHADRESWCYPGFSAIVGQQVLFSVDMASGGRRENDRWIPNIRERLVCPVSNLNNRARLVGALLEIEVRRFKMTSPRIFVMEQLTPFFRWVKDRFGYCDPVAAEFSNGEQQVHEGVAFEDPTELSFPDASKDIIVSQEIFKHVGSPVRAFSECARVLSPGGVMLMSVPFATHSAKTIVRAELVDGELVHRLPAEHHSSHVPGQAPLLVFRKYGWEMLDLARKCGFSDAWLGIYHAPRLGHFGDGLHVFHFRR